MKFENGNNMYLDPLTAVSPVDGRYYSITRELWSYFSEYALIRQRMLVECEYLTALSETKGVGTFGPAGLSTSSPSLVGIRKLSEEEKVILRQLPNISIEEAGIVKKIEKEGYEGIPATNHDVKAVEYYLKKKLSSTSLKDVSEWVHFGLTSEDINSVAYGMLLRSALQSVIGVSIRDIESTLDKLASAHAGTAMLARTHGQSATPTTFGKEMRVFEARLARQTQQLAESILLVKFGGATGNWNAHVVAAPDVDWPAFGKKFIDGLNAGYQMKIELNPVTTQIEPHDTYAELFDIMRRANTILIDFSQDMWRYISDGWLTQKPKEGEVGSSAMPHKVNPIDFENAEGNFGIANALFEHFSRKLPISRLQRDLSDSTVERSFGTAFAHSLIGYRALLRGLGKVEVNEKVMADELAKHPEVIAEAIQTVLRREGVEVPYEKLKELTRGRQVTLEDLAKFIEGLPVDEKVKKDLKAIRPENYIGLADRIAKGK